MPHFEQLEPRILLSADLIPLPVESEPVPVSEPLDESIPALEQSSPESSSTSDIPTDQESVATDDTQSTTANENVDESQNFANQTEDPATGKEIIFINDDIEGFEALKEDLETRENSEVVVLSSSEDGFNQISSSLDSVEDSEAIHFFSHGNEKSIKIGSSWLDEASLEQNKSTIHSWGESLTSDGDILFYGCDLAGSNDGQQLLGDIAAITGADVAASDDATGHHTMGGDWVLEYFNGTVETEIAVSPKLQSDWLHILAEETIADNFTSASYGNNDGSVNWVGDWVEIGESDGEESGNVTIEDGWAKIRTANDSEPERGLSRMADLSEATSAYLTFDVDDFWWHGGRLSIEVRPDGDSSWTTLKDHDIIALSPNTSMQFDISPYISSTTEIRFVSEGVDNGGTSDGNGSFSIDNLRIDYTTDSWSSPLWISTDGDVSNGGQAGLDTWDKADIVGLKNPIQSLGVRTTAEFTMAAQLSAFAEGANINGLHYVTTNMLIGSSEFELKKGDVLITSENPDSNSFGNLDASRDDVIHFRPAAEGDYSSGTFTILFNELVKDKKIHGITLVESDVTVGDRDLHAGDLLFLREGGEEKSDVYHYATVDVEPGSGTTSGTVKVLLEGDDQNVDISKELTGIDLVERNLTIGNMELTEGTLLLSVKDDTDIGGRAIGKHDIFALDVTTTSDPDGVNDDLGEVSARRIFDGSDVDFDDDKERLDGFTLTIPGEIPDPIYKGVSFNAVDQTITLTGENLEYIGDLGENVIDRLDWTKITWDINGDGTTSPDITFDIDDISNVTISPNTLIINLTEDKTLEIVGTTGYAEDGGTDTMTILPGFASNPKGKVATTDTLTDAPIATTTAPQGVALSDTSIPENTNTSGGYEVGTLSTIDADAGDTRTYTITGGADSGLFTIGGTNNDELIIDAGLLDHETKSSYEVEITVTDKDGQTDSQTHTILVSDIDETPEITANSLTLSEGQTVTLTSTNIAATDEETADGSLIFNIETVSGGQFENTDDTGTAISSFSQADVAAGKIIFVDDGDETAPEYTVSVSDGLISSAISTAAISYTPVNDAPVLTNNSLTISEGQRRTLTTTDLTVSDADNSRDALIFNIEYVLAGQFELSTDSGTEISSFTAEELDLGVVQFVHNGGELAPAYTLSLSDGENSLTSSDAVITFTSIDDEPVIQRNSLDIQQGETVTITDIQLLASDPDDAAAALTINITNLVAGEFRLSGVAINSFTQDDINNELVTFVHDNSATPPSYDVEVFDDDGTSSGIEGARVNFNRVNQPPSFDTNSLTIAEGESLTLSSSNFSASDFDHGPESLIYTITGLSNGQFESTDDPGSAISSFSQSDINEGKIIFKHDGSETAPSYSATVSDGSVSDSLDATIVFSNVNDRPVVGNNSLTLSEGQTVVLNSSNLSATDIDSVESALTFTVSVVTGGSFTTTADPGTAINTFTQAQITAGEIQFIHNGGEAAPAYYVTVTDDGSLSSSAQAANIAFTNVNDAPQLVTNSLTISEGGTVSISTSDLSATDAETSGGNLIFSVNSISGGQFERTSLAGSAISSFSQSEILAGDIVFIHNGEEAPPTYQITVTDDDTAPITTTPADATITFSPVNDVPDLTVNTVTISEGATVTLNDSMLVATDSDSSDPNLIFSITDLVAGTFVNSNDPAVPITSFTQEEISNGEIMIVHDGGETPLSYNVSVSDGSLTTTPSPATINYAAINDAPTINVLASTHSYTEDTDLSINDINIDDVDGGTGFQVSLDLSDGAAGILSATDSGTATSTFAGTTLTISGTDINDINATLATVVFSPAADYNETLTLTIAATDGVDVTGSQNILFNAIPVNDSPTASPLNHSGTYTEDTEYDLEDIIVADVDTDEIITATLTLDSPTKGILTTGGDASYDDGTGEWTITGTTSQVNDALSLVSFNPTADSFEDTDISVLITDGGEDGVSPLAGTISLTGDSVADAPVVTPTPTAEPEGDGEPPETGGETPEEEIITPNEEVGEETDTLDLIVGQVDTLDTDPNEDGPTTTSEEEGGGDEDNSVATETSGEEEASDGPSFVNAKKVSQPAGSTPELNIVASFDVLNLNLSFADQNGKLYSSNASTSIQSNSVSLSSTAKENPLFSANSYSLLDLEYRDRSFEEYQSVRKSLDSFREQADNEASIQKTAVGSAIAASTGLSAGYVIWLLRSGALLSSILSSLPAWQLADPLAVLAGTRKEGEEEDDSIEAIIKKGTAQASTENMGDQPQQASLESER